MYVSWKKADTVLKKWHIVAYLTTDASLCPGDRRPDSVGRVRPTGGGGDHRARREAEHHAGRDAAGGRLLTAAHSQAQQVHTGGCQGRPGRRAGRSQAGAVRRRPGVQHEQVPAGARTATRQPGGTTGVCLAALNRQPGDKLCNSKL